jgi:hypothetical protein
MRAAYVFGGASSGAGASMIRTSGYRFSDKIMLQQKEQDAALTALPPPATAPIPQRSS